MNLLGSRGFWFSAGQLPNAGRWPSFATSIERNGKSAAKLDLPKDTSMPKLDPPEVAALEWRACA